MHPDQNLFSVKKGWNCANKKSFTKTLNTAIYTVKECEMPVPNKFNIFYDSGLNVPQIEIRFNNNEPIFLENHTVTEIELEPGSYQVDAIYSLIIGDSKMNFVKKFNISIEKGYDYDAKLCIILKALSLVKRPK